MRTGVVAEGTYDVPAFEELIPKIDRRVIKVVVRLTGTKTRFLQAFPGLLWTFLHVEPGRPVDKVIGIRDANSEDPEQVEAAMRQQLESRRRPHFRGDIELHATRRETETWLLADVDAINAIALAGRVVQPVPGPLEAIPDAKGRFKRLLWQAGLRYTPEIVRAVARGVNLEAIREQCPGFRRFEEKIRR